MSTSPQKPILETLLQTVGRLRGAQDDCAACQQVTIEALLAALSIAEAHPRLRSFAGLRAGLKRVRPSKAAIQRAIRDAEREAHG